MLHLNPDGISGSIVVELSAVAGPADQLREIFKPSADSIASILSFLGGSIPFVAFVSRVQGRSSIVSRTWERMIRFAARRKMINFWESGIEFLCICCDVETENSRAESARE
jgi:hypothetical protein